MLLQKMTLAMFRPRNTVELKPHVWLYSSLNLRMITLKLSCQKTNYLQTLAVVLLYKMRARPSPISHYRCLLLSGCQPAFWCFLQWKCNQRHLDTLTNVQTAHLLRLSRSPGPVPVKINDTKWSSNSLALLLSTIAPPSVLTPRTNFLK